MTKTIKETMSPADRVQECYQLIQEALEMYGCDFKCSVTFDGENQHFFVDVVLSDETVKAEG